MDLRDLGAQGTYIRLYVRKGILPNLLAGGRISRCMSDGSSTIVRKIVTCYKLHDVVVFVVM